MDGPSPPRAQFRSTSQPGPASGAAPRGAPSGEVRRPAAGASRVDASIRLDVLPDRQKRGLVSTGAIRVSGRSRRHRTKPCFCPGNDAAALLFGRVPSSGRRSGNRPGVPAHRHGADAVAGDAVAAGRRGAGRHGGVERSERSVAALRATVARMAGTNGAGAGQGAGPTMTPFRILGVAHAAPARRLPERPEGESRSQYRQRLIQSSAAAKHSTPMKERAVFS